MSVGRGMQSEDSASDVPWIRSTWIIECLDNNNLSFASNFPRQNPYEAANKVLICMSECRVTCQWLGGI